MFFLRTIFFFIIISQLTVGTTFFVRAAEIVAAKLSSDEKKALTRIEAYLNDMKTLRAGFLQISSDNTVATGNMFMSRPGKIRFEYDPPSPILLVSDGVFLIYIDKELEQKTHVWLSNTPIGFLTESNIKLDGDVTVTGFSMGPNVYSMTLVRTLDPQDGRITMIFSDQPLALRKWTITDSNGIKTTISLNNLERGITINPSVFEIKEFQFKD